MIKRVLKIFQKSENKIIEELSINITKYDAIILSDYGKGVY